MTTAFRLSQPQRELLRSTTQRYRLYFAPFGSYQFHVTTVKKDAFRSRVVNRGKWYPQINLGPHRIAFVGEPIAIDARDSFMIEFDVHGNRHHGGGHDQGHGKGNLCDFQSWQYELDQSYFDEKKKDDTQNMGNQDKLQLSWQVYKVDLGDPVTGREPNTRIGHGVDDQNAPTTVPRYDVTSNGNSWQPLANWDEVRQIAFPEPGLWRVEVGRNLRKDGDPNKKTSLADTLPLAVRWVRVYQDRDHAEWDVTGVSGLSGTYPGGWKCNISVKRQDDLDPAPTGFDRFQCFGLYCEEEWLVDGEWVRQPIGACRQEPRCLFVGYATEGGISLKADTKEVTLSLETIDGQMSRSMMHKLAIWQAKGNIPDQPSASQRRSVRKNRHDERKAKRNAAKTGTTYTPATDTTSNNDNTNKNSYDPNEVDKYGNSTDTWGDILHGFKWVCVTDFVCYVLQFKTNLTRWHDFYPCWNNQLGDLESIAGEESPVLSNLQHIAENDWMATGADHTSAFYFGPDRQITTDPGAQGWDAYWPPAMPFEAEDLLDIQVTQSLEKRTKYVRLIAMRTASQRQLVVNFPSKQPLPTQPGTWYLKQDLLHDNKQVLQRRAKKVFIYENLIWKAKMTTVLNRGVRAGDYVTIRVPFWKRDDLNPAQEAEWYPYGLDKLFLVTGVSHDLDPSTAKWQTSLEVEEAVSGLSLNEISSMGPVTDNPNYD